KAVVEARLGQCALRPRVVGGNSFGLVEIQIQETARPGGVGWIALDLPEDGAADAGDVAEAIAELRYRNRLAHRLDAAQSAVCLLQLRSHGGDVNAVNERHTNPGRPEIAAVERQMPRQCQQSKYDRDRDVIPGGSRGQEDADRGERRA